MFSRSRISPGARVCAFAVTSAPVIAGINCTGFPSNSAKRTATGASESSGFTSPLGRPRCAAITMLAPFARSALIVGSDARIRPSSVIFDSFKGTLRSHRRNTRLPATSRSTNEVIREIYQHIPLGQLVGLSNPIRCHTNQQL